MYNAKKKSEVIADAFKRLAEIDMSSIASMVRDSHWYRRELKKALRQSKELDNFLYGRV
jgi:hypothetical protein